MATCVRPVLSRGITDLNATSSASALVAAAPLVAGGVIGPVESVAVPPPVSPALPGPYVPGVLSTTIQRPSVTSGEVRTHELVIWYPARGEAAATTAVDASLRAAPGIPPASGRFPVVVFSHAAASSPLQSTFLTTHLASHGYVVAALSHPGSTFDDCLGCGDQARMDALLRESALNRPHEAAAVLDVLGTLDRDAASLLLGRVDTSRAAVLGHSWGGYTAVMAAAIEPRFRAAIAMAPVVNASVSTAWQQLRVPVMVMGSRLDDITPFTPQEQLFGIGSAASPRFLVAFPRGGHTAYSEVCPDGTPGCRPGELGEARAHELVRAYVTGFLRRYLEDDTRYGPVLTPAAAPEEVEISIRG